MGKTLNVGVIGVGTIGKSQLRGYAAVKEAKIAGISDINEKALESVGKEFKVKRQFTNYHDLLALEGLDAVSVCTPPFNHAVVTVDAASAGKHVLCEKPMAMNAKEAKEMLEACNEAGVKLGIGSGRSRFSPPVDMARRCISDGKLGKVYYSRTSSYRRRGRPGIDILVDTKWFIDSSKAGGGALIDIGCYDIDVILCLLGSPQPKSVSAMTFQGIEDLPELDVTYDVEEHSSVFVRFEEGPVALFETTWATNYDNTQEAIIMGTKGGLKLNPFTYYTKQDQNQVAIKTDLRIQWGIHMKLLVEDFTRACLEDKMPKTPGEDGLKVMQVINGAYESSKLGREVQVSEL